MREQDTDAYHGMTRSELNDRAGELGIADAASLANKDEVIAAIESAMMGQSTTDEENKVDVFGGTEDDTEPEPESEPEKAEGDRFRVLKAFTLDDGRTVMPGEEFAPGDIEKWPARRSKQMVDQKYLRPMD